MVKKQNNLSYSWQETSSIPLGCNLLFANNCIRNTLKNTLIHSHDYWQMELINRGSIICNLAEGSHRLGRNQIILIPPATAHRFEYKRKDISWLTFKFQLDISDNFKTYITHLNDMQIEGFIMAIRSIYKGIKTPTQSLRIMTESLLSGIVAHLLGEYFEKEAPELILEIEKYIAMKINEPIRLKDIAEALGYSENHLSIKYQKMTGMHLKQLIDAKRAVHAKHLLLFTEKNVGEIAEEMGFDNIYSFSRFFKRVMSITPSSLRHHE